MPGLGLADTASLLTCCLVPNTRSQSSQDNTVTHPLQSKQIPFTNQQRSDSVTTTLKFRDPSKDCKHPHRAIMKSLSADKSLDDRSLRTCAPAGFPREGITYAPQRVSGMDFTKVKGIPVKNHRTRKQMESSWKCHHRTKDGFTQPA